MDISSYKSFLKKEYPSAYEFLKHNPRSPAFFSEPVALSFIAFQQMKTIVQSLFQLKKKEEYQARLLAKATYETALKKQKQDSVLMAYDFHLKEGMPQLIEVNTNASSFLLVNSLYQFKNWPYQTALEDLKKSFQSEWDKFNAGSAVSPPKKTVLIDEDPFNQKQVIEFLMYKDLFQSMNWPFEICDARSLQIDDEGFLYTSQEDKIDFIYNRSTDFYFKNHPHLAKAYEQGACAISPHPREYYLLADKSRLHDWHFQREEWPELQNIKSHLPFSEILNSKNKDQIWKDRKKYFFKICQGYGGKRVYRGSSVSRPKFEDLCEWQSLVQAYIPPSVTEDSNGEKWKTDFRAYVYEDQIQQLAARCYQGQVTNFKKEGSGFAVVALEK